MGTPVEVIKVKRETFDDIKARLTARNPESDSWDMLGGEISLNGIAIEPEDESHLSEATKFPIYKVAEALMRLRHVFKLTGLSAPKAIILGDHEDEKRLIYLDRIDSRHVFSHVDPRDNTLELCGIRMHPNRREPAYIDTRRVHEALAHMLHHFNEIQADKNKMSTTEIADGLFEIGDQAMKQLGILMEMVDTHNEKESRRV